MDSGITSDAPAPTDEVASAAKRAKLQDDDAFASVPVVNSVPWSSYMSDLFIVVPSVILEEGSKALERIPVHRVQLALFPFFQHRLTGSWSAASTSSTNAFNNIDCGSLEYTTGTWIQCLKRLYKINPFFTKSEEIFAQFDSTFADGAGCATGEMELFAYLFGEDIPTMVLNCIKMKNSESLIAVASAFVETNSALDLDSLKAFKRIYDAAVENNDDYNVLERFVTACKEQSQFYIENCTDGGKAPEDAEYVPPLMNLLRWILILCGLAHELYHGVWEVLDNFDDDVASKFKSKPLQDLNMAIWSFKPCCSHFARSDSDEQGLRHRMLEAEHAIYAGSPSHVVIPNMDGQFWTFVLEDVVFEGPCCFKSENPRHIGSNSVRPFGATKDLPIFQVFKVQHRTVKGRKISEMPEYKVYCNSYSLAFM